MANGAIKSEKNKSGYIRNIAQPVSSTNNIEKARFNPILFTECSESASDEEKIELMSIGEDAKATETVRVNQNVLTREEQKKEKRRRKLSDRRRTKKKKKVKI